MRAAFRQIAIVHDLISERWRSCQTPMAMSDVKVCRWLAYMVPTYTAYHNSMSIEGRLRRQWASLAYIYALGPSKCAFKTSQVVRFWVFIALCPALPTLTKCAVDEHARESLYLFRRLRHSESGRRARLPLHLEGNLQPGPMLSPAIKQAPTTSAQHVGKRPSGATRERWTEPSPRAPPEAAAGGLHTCRRETVCSLQCRTLCRLSLLTKS